jgi:hypothetical protein
MIRPGEAFRCQGYLFKPQKRVPVELVMVWERGQREPWCLVTNDRTLTAARYARRMWQEQGFRDLKSGGWPWESSHLRHPERMERYLLVLALAYAWMLTLGSMSVAGSTPIYSEDLVKRYSVFRLGLRYFKERFHHRPQEVVIGLFFAPRPSLLWASKLSPLRPIHG